MSRICTGMLTVALMFLGGCEDDGAGGAGRAIQVPDLQPGVSEPTPEPAEPTAAASVADPEAPLGAAVSWRLSDSPAVTIGVVSGASEYELFRIREVRRLSDGRIVVANAGSSELRFFSAEGQYLFSSGGQGDGPGEFRNLTWMDVTPLDSIIAFDTQGGRISVFDPSGDFIHSVRLPEHMRVVGLAVTMRIPHGIFSDGSLFVEERVATEGGRLHERTGIISDSLDYVRFDPRDPDNVQPSGRFPLPQTFALAGQTGTISLPLGARPALVAHGEAVYFGPSDQPEVAVHTPSGELIRVIRWSHERRPVTAELIEGERTRRLDDPSVSDASRELVEPLLRGAPWPDELPAYGDLRLDVEGNLWVAEYDPVQPESLSNWTVLNSEGAIVASVATPRELVVQQIGSDFLLGVAIDELGVAAVRLYTLIKDGGGT